MAAPRIGSDGVLTTKGDLLVTDANGNAERLPVGADGLGLVADSTAALGVAYKSVASRAPVFVGGANMGAGDVGKYFGAQDISNGGKSLVLSSDNQMANAITGFLDTLTWESQTASATTVFKIVKNGLTVATITLTGVSGSITLAPLVAVVAGDLITVRYDSSTAPGRTTTQVWGRR